MYLAFLRDEAFFFSPSGRELCLACLMKSRVQLGDPRGETRTGMMLVLWLKCRGDSFAGLDWNGPAGIDDRISAY